MSAVTSAIPFVSSLFGDSGRPGGPGGGRGLDMDQMWSGTIPFREKMQGVGRFLDQRAPSGLPFVREGESYGNALQRIINSQAEKLRGVNVPLLGNMYDRYNQYVKPRLEDFLEPGALRLPENFGQGAGNVERPQFPQIPQLQGIQARPAEYYRSKGTF